MIETDKSVDWLKAYAKGYQDAFDHALNLICENLIERDINETCLLSYEQCANEAYDLLVEHLERRTESFPKC